MNGLARKLAATLPALGLALGLSQSFSAAQTSLLPLTPRDAIRSAAEALGGTDRVMAIRTLVIEGSGINPRLLSQSDLFDFYWHRHLWGDNYIKNLETLKLHFDKDLPVHGKILTYDEEVAIIKKFDQTGRTDYTP